MKSLLLVGKPACGKGTQSEMLKSKDFQHFGMGDLLRRHKKEKTRIGKLAIDIDKNGGLMPDDIIIELMRSEIQRLIKNQKPIVFDGVARTIKQYKILSDIMENIGAEFETVYIHISDEISIKRSLLRGESSNRVEDSDVNIIKNRLNVYNEQTNPILTNFHYHIDGNLPKEVINNKILEICQKD